MYRFLSLAFGVVLLATASTPATADWTGSLHPFWHSVKRDFHRNNCWPEPFLRADAVAVRSPFATMVNNGWRLQNLLADHHFNFEEEEHKLTPAGNAKVRWILTQAPPQHRTIFVQRGLNGEETAARIEIVQDAAVKIVPRGELPAVEATHLVEHGWPAANIDPIFRQFEETIPPPRLPEPEKSD